MKRKQSLSLIFIIAFTLMIGLTSCTLHDNSLKSPNELIQDAYGNKEFKISFSSETLDKPLEDITYSANKIPTLPTPQKVGYIFEGWFLDSDFTMPYTDDTLLLSMKDITLYPKWSVETFRHNGTYDIEFTSCIIPESLKKGKDTDRYGGFRDFSDCIVHDQCYIEKSDDCLLLKIQFDSKTTIPFQTSGKVFTVRMNKKMSTNIYIKDKIDSLSDQIKTIFIKIDDWDLSDTLYLDIEWLNYESKEVNESNRKNTLTKYTVGIDLTKIIGFSRAFVDSSVPLEKGYYLAKSYYRQENNTQSMAKNYNPVYSYIYSDGNENYKLIKQNTPYYGLVADKHPLYKPLTNNYYDSIMTFTSVMMCYDMESRGYDGVVDSEFYPETYNAGKYHRTITEFHADTGKYYNIIELDKDLSKEYTCLTAVSGYMERYDGMGYIKQVLSIDYQNLIKLAEVDYVPLEGDAFEYTDDFMFYPGDFKDLEQKNLIKPLLLEHGLSIEMPNFFYSAPSITSLLKDKKIHSSKVEVVPNKKTSVMNLASSRGEIGEFEMNAKVYGYDPNSKDKLFLDKMTVQNLAGNGYNSQLRDVREIKVGKTVSSNEEIVLSKLFNEKVNRNINFNDVETKIYGIIEDRIDLNDPLEVSSKIKYTKDCGIVFSYLEDGNKYETTVYLKHRTDPNITIYDDYNWTKQDDNHYTKNITTTVDTYVNYPDVKYTWGDFSGRLVENFYEQMNGDLSVHPGKAVYFGVSKDYNKLYLSLGLQGGFKIPEKNVTLMYELNNEFYEREYIYFDYFSDPKPNYIVKDEIGTIIAEDDIKFDKDGNRKQIYNTTVRNVFYDTFDSSWIDNYYHYEDGYKDPYNLNNIYIYTQNSQYSISVNGKSNDQLAKEINNLINSNSYALIQFSYFHGYDWLVCNYLYNMTFNGESTFETISHDAYFTNTLYTIPRIKLVGTNRIPLSKINLNVKKYVDNRPYTNPNGGDVRLGYTDSQYEVMFLTPGTYRFEITYPINDGILDLGTGNTEIIKFYQFIEVDSNKTDIEITFITDDLHPFKNGELEQTVIYNLGQGIKLLSESKEVFDKSKFGFDRGSDKLTMWSTTKNTYGITYTPNTVITGDKFIDEYNSKKLTLYAIWEIKFSVYCDTGQEILTTKAYLDYGGTRYTIKFPTIRPSTIPADTVFMGWTGGFLGSRITKEQYVYVPYQDDYWKEEYIDYFTVHAVYKKQYNVTFEVDTSIAKFVRSEKVFEGEHIPNVYDKLHVQIIDKNYKFIGYYIDNENEIIDLTTYIVTGPTAFKAKFEYIGS